MEAAAARSVGGVHVVAVPSRAPRLPSGASLARPQLRIWAGRAAAEAPGRGRAALSESGRGREPAMVRTGVT